MKIDNVIDLRVYSHVENWDTNPLARRAAYRLAHHDLRKRYNAAKAAGDYGLIDNLEREWEGLCRY